MYKIVQIILIIDVLNLTVELTPIKVKFEDAPLKGIRSILIDLNHSYVRPMLEFHGLTCKPIILYHVEITNNKLHSKAI